MGFEFACEVILLLFCLRSFTIFVIMFYLAWDTYVFVYYNEQYHGHQQLSILSQHTNAHP